MTGYMKDIKRSEPQFVEQRVGNRHERRKKEKLSRQLDGELRKHGVTDPAEVEAIKRKVLGS